jgi:NAD(P)-dependent dehydrogenase (short-subunit alcohol dehydrogenase family)
VTEEIRRAGGKALAVKADVSSQEDVASLFETATKSLGPLGALVNNAGIVEKQARVENMDAARLALGFAVNITGAFLCAREAVRRMSVKHGGRGGAIVNVWSVAARLGAPDEYVDYAAAKAAIDTMTIGLAKGVAADGMRVNAVRSGVVYTDLHASGGEPNRVERVKEFVPMKRGGYPEEIAQAILWLLSDEASYCTGAIIDVADAQARFDRLLILAGARLLNGFDDSIGFETEL